MLYAVLVTQPLIALNVYQQLFTIKINVIQVLLMEHFVIRIIFVMIVILLFAQLVLMIKINVHPVILVNIYSKIYAQRLSLLEPIVNKIILRDILFANHAIIIVINAVDL